MQEINLKKEELLLVLTKEDILKIVDHTLLKPIATKSDIDLLCEEAILARTFSVCVPPSFVSFCKKKLIGSGVKICTVVGFPNGYSTVKSKIFEAEDALANGADEIDMVINLGFVKEKKYSEELNEILSIKKVCGNKVLKVIIETCYLTQEEKIEMCKVVTNSGADYIKTSTGFGPAGATIEDVKLIKKYIGNNVKIKVAGGISDFSLAEKFINLGASRIGSSKLVGLAKKLNRKL